MQFRRLCKCCKCVDGGAIPSRPQATLSHSISPTINFISTSKTHTPAPPQHHTPTRRLAPIVHNTFQSHIAPRHTPALPFAAARLPMACGDVRPNGRQAHSGQVWRSPMFRSLMASHSARRSVAGVRFRSVAKISSRHSQRWLHSSALQIC